MDSTQQFSPKIPKPSESDSPSDTDEATTIRPSGYAKAPNNISTTNRNEDLVVGEKDSQPLLKTIDNGDSSSAFDTEATIISAQPAAGATRGMPLGSETKLPSNNGGLIRKTSSVVAAAQVLLGQ